GPRAERDRGDVGYGTKPTRFRLTGTPARTKPKHGVPPSKGARTKPAWLHVGPNLAEDSAWNDRARDNVPDDPLPEAREEKRTEVEDSAARRGQEGEALSGGGEDGGQPVPHRARRAHPSRMGLPHRPCLGHPGGLHPPIPGNMPSAEFD